MGSALVLFRQEAFVGSACVCGSGRRGTSLGAGGATVDVDDNVAFLRGVVARFWDNHKFSLLAVSSYGGRGE